MPGKLSEYKTFWNEFRQTFHTTGAVLPSGRRLSRALASQVGRDERPRRILEVGPGTGAVTSEIVRRLGADDRLDLVELNERFVEILRRRLAEESAWQSVATRVRVLQLPVEELPLDEKYECIVSGLPLNNFDCDFVRKVLEHFHCLAAEGCTLSFFEYVAIRNLKSLVSSRDERKRLHGIGQILKEELTDWEFQRQMVVANVPPAWVHHLRYAAPLPCSDEYPIVQTAVC
ncbi:class I SAM-dependent methyltransferase [Bythopirellula goksoeyrii]|uniref:16S ribosomal RNA methyltransferase KsgA/Dim1 family protein n=1 Tax=Bythopirellula goksoeyrii TaxID=1400387 RepID=A0A5B9Q976_9BACT|nr:methyltransferase domain-containing protein [Bythopirellula goksoeyrii]QEG34259.1 16S ribosomal RNA methyltransferase KsgA/Dim1 family protein [Bythopirellula goksoeyrii]